MDSYMALAAGLGLGVIVLTIAIVIACYVVVSLSHMKALNALGYDKAWMAWIPYANYFAYADSVTKGEEKVRIFDSFEVPAFVFKFWWLVSVLLLFIPIPFKSIINLAIQVVFLGSTYAKMYSKIEFSNEKDNTVIGVISGFSQLLQLLNSLQSRNNYNNIKIPVSIRSRDLLFRVN